MKGSAFFLKVVAKFGINNVFGIVGGEAQAMQFDEEANINFYLTRHEFAAGIMADVYSRITGKPQMCYSTFGPGLSNLSTGVVSAILDRSPILVVSAQIHRSELSFNQTHQCIDNVSFMRPITKFAAEINDIYCIDRIIKEALEIAINDIPGPVYLSFPYDVMESSIPDEVANEILKNITPLSKKTIEPANNNAIQVVINEVKKAKHPIFIVGNQVIREDCCDDFVLLAEQLNIPVLSTLASKGIIPEDHPLFITACNKYIDKIYGENLISEIFNNCDLLVMVGYDFGEDLKPTLWKNKIKTVVINSFYQEMPHIFQPDNLCLGNLKQTIKSLLYSNVLPKDDNNSLLILKQVFDKREGKKSDKFTNIPEIIKAIRNALGETGILCSDIGLHKQYAGLLSKTYKPNTFLCSNVCGTFGFGFPAGLAASLVDKRNRVAVICGDGGFHSTSQDLETAVRYNIPLVTIVLKDNAFGLIKYYQYLEREDIFNPSVEFGNVDFVKLAEANGMSGILIHDLDELEATINKAFKEEKPLLIEIPITYDYRLRGEHVSIEQNEILSI